MGKNVQPPTPKATAWQALNRHAKDRLANLSRNRERLIRIRWGDDLRSHRILGGIVL